MDVYKLAPVAGAFLSPGADRPPLSPVAGTFPTPGADRPPLPPRGEGWGEGPEALEAKIAEINRQAEQKTAFVLLPIADKVRKLEKEIELLVAPYAKAVWDIEEKRIRAIARLKSSPEPARDLRTAANRQPRTASNVATKEQV